VDRRAVDGPAEHVGGEHGDIGDRQRRHLDPVEELVLPEHDDGLRRRLAGAQRHDREHAAVEDEMQEQRRRRVVEVVGVVHHEHQPMAVPVIDHGLGEGTQQVPATLRLAARRRWEQRRERAVGDGRRAAVGAHVGGAVPPLGREIHALDRETGLADAGRPGEQHASGLAVHGRRHLRELGHPADQRPRRRVHDRRIPLLPHPCATAAVSHAGTACDGGSPRESQPSPVGWSAR
jgi:hypothetical protein